MELGCKGETELTGIPPGHLQDTVGNNLVKPAGDRVDWQHAQALSQAGCLVPSLLHPSGMYVISTGFLTTLRMFSHLKKNTELMKEFANRMGASFCWTIKCLRQFLEYKNNWLMTSIIISTTAGSCYYYGSNEEDPARGCRNRVRTKLFAMIRGNVKCSYQNPPFSAPKTQIFLE